MWKGEVRGVEKMEEEGREKGMVKDEWERCRERGGKKRARW